VQLHLVRLVMNEVFLQFLLRVPTSQQFAGVPFWLLHHLKVTKLMQHFNVRSKIKIGKFAKTLKIY
jgi:hypothetical protein